MAITQHMHQGLTQHAQSTAPRGGGGRLQSVLMRPPPPTVICQNLRGGGREGGLGGGGGVAYKDRAQPPAPPLHCANGLQHTPRSAMLTESSLWHTILTPLPPCCPPGGPRGAATSVTAKKRTTYEYSELDSDAEMVRAKSTRGG